MKHIVDNKDTISHIVSRTIMFLSENIKFPI